MSGKIAALHRFPVKGLSEDEMVQTKVTAGELFPHDRRYGVALSLDDSNPLTPATGEWRPKRHFAMLAKSHRLAQLQTLYNEDTSLLTILRKGRQVSQGKLNDRMGRILLEQFFASFLQSEGTDKPRLIEAQDQAFTDIPHRQISLINLASVEELAQKMGKEIDPKRFRGNILVEGLAPWEEREWIESEISIGPIRFRVESNIGRCKATNVNLETAELDMNIPKSLLDHYGHSQMGIYMTALNDGILQTGQAIKA